MQPIAIQCVEEYRVDPALEGRIARLLSQSFPGYPAERTYFMQLPDFRLLATWDETLAGHLAAEHRVIAVGGTPHRIFGVADLCVEGSFRRRKIGTMLLEFLERMARESRVDFIVLIASERPFYLRNGFRSVGNLCRWLAIEDFQTQMIIQHGLAGDLLIKPISGKVWGKGLVDFMGAIF